VGVKIRQRGWPGRASTGFSEWRCSMGALKPAVLPVPVSRLPAGRRLQYERDRLHLHGCGLGIARIGDGAQQRLREPELAK